MARFPTGTVTFLFTDIEGSTRLLSELGDAYADVLAEHRRVLRKVFARHRGIEVDTQGDAFCYVFAGAKDAVAAAADAERALATGRVRVRIGIHTGEPLVTGEGYVGIDVHRGARIAAAGHGGQVLISQTTRDLLDSSIELHDLGEYRLKDLGEPLRLYQLGGREFPPPNSLNWTNLPVQPTPLVGRGRELEEAGALLREHRLVTLTGPGGSGKTRLALQLAADATEQFADGVFWVPLVSVREPELVEPTIAEVVGAKDGLGSHLRGKRVLLLLDNFEQVVTGAQHLATLLGAAPEIKLLVTSRTPLRLAGEREYPVLPLAEDEAVALFGERARAVKPTFAEDEQIGEICRRLDRLPLAIELAAARVRALAPAQILERLDRRLPLLTGGPRDAPERQRTLRATIEWSHELLCVEERRLFRRLAVFVGRFELEAVKQVCEADLDRLESLVAQNLVISEGERFTILEAIREYAAEQLAQAGERQEFERRHAHHYLERACELADQRLLIEPRRRRREAADGWFWAERENLRAAFAFFTEIGDAQAQLNLGGSDVIWTSGFAEGRRVLAQLLEQTAGEESEARRRALLTAGHLAMAQSDMTDALRYGEELLALARSAGDANWIVLSLVAVHAYASRLGDFDRARAAAREGEKLARELELTDIAVLFINNRASEEAERGNLAAARKSFGEAFALNADSDGSRTGRALILLGLGGIAVEEGKLTEATTLFVEAVGQVHEVRRFGSIDLLLAGAVEGFAAVAAGRGDPATAARLLGAAHAWRQLDNTRLQEWEQRIHDNTVAAIQAQLSADDFTGTFTSGRNLTLDEAIDYAHATGLVQAERD